MSVSRRRHLAVGFGAAALLLLGLGALSARPLVPAERRDLPYSGHLRACEDPMVTGYIQGAFSSRESEYWHSGLEIVGFEDVREIGFRSNGLDYIPRRYCTARAVLNHNQVRSVSYSIDEDSGDIGFTDNVVWCVNGLDREGDYAPGCKMARP